MRKKYLLSICCIILFAFFGCEHENIQFIVNDFEDVFIEKETFYDGSDLSGVLDGDVYKKEIITGSVRLFNYYKQTGSGGLWNGFAVSSRTDTIDKTNINLYTSIAGHGAMSSSNYAVIRDSAQIFLPSLGFYQQPKSVVLNNTSYMYYNMLNGSDICRKFTNGDWFRVVVTGMLGEEITGEVEFYLADFRDKELVLIRNWTRLNLRALGAVDKILFNFTSSYEEGCNHPLKFVCVDNLEIIVPGDSPLLDEYDN
jgi:hypothetical protein